MTQRIAPLIAVLSAALLAAACQDAPTSAPLSRPQSEHAMSRKAQIIPGRYIVQLRRGENPAAVAREYGVTARHVWRHAIVGFEGAISDSLAARLLRDPRVQIVEQDQVAWMATTQSPAPSWGLDRVDQRALPLNNAYSYLYNGSGVTVYIIDSGILISHTDFGGRASVGYDIGVDGRNGIDCNGHGTHVAGTVAGTKYGIAKSASLVAVRVFFNCSDSTLTPYVIDGVDWVTAHHSSPAVANMSLGSAASALVDSAVAASIASGVAYSVSAGNYNMDACNMSPGRLPAAMTVAATDNSDAEWFWSNWGDCVDWYAPGVNIMSDWIGSNTDTRAGTGTSMAAPHTAGLAALVRQAYPWLSASGVRDTIFAHLSMGVVRNALSANNHLIYTRIGPAWITPTLSSISTNPSPPRQYTPFSVTLNGSGFDPATVQVVYTVPPCYPGIQCTGVIPNDQLSVKTPTQVVIPYMTFGIAGEKDFQVQNSPYGGLSNSLSIIVVPMY